MILWEFVPLTIKVIVFSVVALCIAATAVLVNVGFKLSLIFRRTAPPVPSGAGEFELEALFEYAVATNWVRIPASHADCLRRMDHRGANERFLSLWLDYFSRIRMAHRMSIVAIWLAVLSVTYGVVPTCIQMFGEPLPKTLDITFTALQLLGVFAFQMPFCMVAYCLSRHFADTLECRRNVWQDLFPLFAPLEDVVIDSRAGEDIG